MTNFNSTTTSSDTNPLGSFSSALGRCVSGFLLACLPLSMLAPSSAALGSDEFGDALTGELAASGSPIPDLWGDDTIGVLPVVGDGGTFSGTGVSVLDMIMLFSSPSIVLEGSINDLKRMIIDADGGASSFVYFEGTTPGDGRLIFQGDSTIELDRQLFKTNRVTVSMLTGLTHTRNRVQLSQGGKFVSTFMMPGGVARPLDLNAAITRGVLDNGPLRAAVSHTQRLAPDHLSFEADTQRVTLRQFQ